MSLAVGQNDRDSVRYYLKQCLITVLAVGLVVELVCQLAPGAITSLLLEGDSALFGDTVSALRQYALSYLPAGISIALAGYFAALGKGFASGLLSLCRGFLFLPGALLALFALGGGLSIWMASLIGEVITLILALILLKKTKF